MLLLPTDVPQAVEYALNRAHVLKQEAMLRDDATEAQACEERMTRLRRHIEIHRENRHKIRTFEAELKALAKAQALLRARRPGADADWLRNHAFKSLDMTYVVHEDDASAVDEPILLQQTQGMGLEKFRRFLHGSTDVLRDWAHFSFPELGMGSKNASSVFDEIVLHLLTHLNGEKFVVILLDCASLNQNALVMFGLAQLLVDLKIVTASSRSRK